MSDKDLSRRDFLKLGGLALGSMAFTPSLVAKGPDYPPQNYDERLRWIKDHPAFKGIQEAYHQNGLPAVATAEYYEEATRSIDRTPEIVCHVPTTGYGQYLQNILNVAFELTGDEFTRNYLHRIKVSGYTSIADTSYKTLLIGKHTNSALNSQHTIARASANIHEQLHFMERAKNVMPLSKKLESDLIIARAVARHGIIKTNHDLYSNSMFYRSAEEQAFLKRDNRESIFTAIGRDTLTDIQGALAYGNNDLQKLVDEAKQVNPKDDWGMYKLGLEIMEVIKPNPEDIPSVLKRIVTSRLLSTQVASEAWSSIAQLVVTKNDVRPNSLERPYSEDVKLHQYFMQYIDLVGPNNFGLDELISRLKSPTGKTPKYRMAYPNEPQNLPADKM